MSFYSVMKTTYKTIFPNALRKIIYRCTPMFLKNIRKSILDKLKRSAAFDEIYDETFFVDQLSNEQQNKSYEVIAEDIMKVFSPRSVVDVGCGSGLLLLALKKQGVVCRGLENASAAVNICHQNGLNVLKFNLECDTLPKDFRADVVVSTEVAEHLIESCAGRFVDILGAIADNVVMTAAGPAVTYCGSHTHLNEQPKEYWIDKFADIGFKYDEDATVQFQTRWKEREVSPWFVQHLMVFRKERKNL